MARSARDQRDGASKVMVRNGAKPSSSGVTTISPTASPNHQMRKNSK